MDKKEPLPSTRRQAARGTCDSTDRDIEGSQVQGTPTWKRMSEATRANAFHHLGSYWATSGFVFASFRSLFGTIQATDRSPHREWDI